MYPTMPIAGSYDGKEEGPRATGCASRSAIQFFEENTKNALAGLIQINFATETRERTPASNSYGRPSVTHT
jgi:hypothetical protein